MGIIEAQNREMLDSDIKDIQLTYYNIIIAAKEEEFKQVLQSDKIDIFVIQE